MIQDLPRNGQHATDPSAAPSPLYLARKAGMDLYERWHDMHVPARLAFILDELSPQQWAEDDYLPTIASFRHDAVAWLHLTEMFKSLFGSARKLEGAVDQYLQGAQEPDAKETPAPPAKQPSLTTLADVQERPVEWLWHPYLAKGTIAMLDGDPGLGKSWIAIQIAACLSRGFPLPGQQGRPTLPTGAPQHVILITAEDSPEHTIKPRLLQAGGDPALVHILNGWTDPTAKDPTELQAFTLEHIPVLEDALRQFPAALVVIDPLQAYLGRVDMHRSNETRPLMTRLADLARKHNTVILCIRHPSKPGQNGGRAIHRGLGSIDLIGIARTGLNLLPHPLDSDKGLLAQGKNNLGGLGRTLIFSKAEGHFTWAGVSRLSADVLAATGPGPEASRLIEACFWLEEELAGGVPQLAKDLEQRMAEEGMKRDTINRAKKLLGIRSIQSGTFADPVWHWKLPDLTLVSPLPLSPLQDLQPLQSLQDLQSLQSLRENQALTATSPPAEVGDPGTATPPPGEVGSPGEGVEDGDPVDPGVTEVPEVPVVVTGEVPPAPTTKRGYTPPCPHAWLEVPAGRLCAKCNLLVPVEGASQGKEPR